MSKLVPIATPAINRLRAAAALIPIIESGLVSSRISVERATTMATFCEWSLEKPLLGDSDADADAAKLVATIGDGLKRIKAVLASPA